MLECIISGDAEWLTESFTEEELVKLVEKAAEHGGLNITNTGGMNPHEVATGEINGRHVIITGADGEKINFNSSDNEKIVRAKENFLDDYSNLYKGDDAAFSGDRDFASETNGFEETVAKFKEELEKFKDSMNRDFENFQKNGTFNLG